MHKSSVISSKSLQSESPYPGEQLFRENGAVFRLFSEMLWLI